MYHDKYPAFHATVMKFAPESASPGGTEDWTTHIQLAYQLLPAQYQFNGLQPATKAILSDIARVLLGGPRSSQAAKTILPFMKRFDFVDGRGAEEAPTVRLLLFIFRKSGPL